jgi:signal transduction histidine kinase
VLADAAAPHPAERDWVDLNALVRRVVQLMGYDRRYRRLAFDTDLDTALPAIRTVGDAVQQTLMQMISLACDALSALDTPEQRVCIRTRHDDERLEVQIVIASALDFELEHVRRGVLLARAIVEPLRGQLAFDQAPAGGSQISLSFPARSGDEPS